MDANEAAAVAEVARALAAGAARDAERPAQETVSAVAALIAQRSDVSDDLRRIVFGEDSESYDPTKLFQQVLHVQSALGFGEASSTIAGHVWASLMGRISAEERSRLLGELLLVENLGFFAALRSLPVVFANVQLAANFVIPWLLKLRARIANDYGGAGFWQSLQRWVEADPPEVLKGLVLLCERELGDGEIAIASTLLGNLRVPWENAADSNSGFEFEGRLRAHLDVRLRLVFHRSWVNTGWKRGLSHEEFSACLNRMSAGTPEERSEAFNFLRCLVGDARTPAESIELALTWLDVNATPATDEQAKRCVVSVVHSLLQRGKPDDHLIKRLRGLLVAIQPIAVARGDIWQQIEQFLVDLLAIDQLWFRAAVQDLLRAHREAIKHYFGRHNTFQLLYGELRQSGKQRFYADMFFSPERVDRQFAFTVFEQMPFSEFPDGMLAGKSDDEVALCVYELRLHHLQAAQTSDFLNMLRSCAEHGGAPLVNLFREELLYQAKNYPGGVLARLEREETSSELVRSVVAEANKYFEALRVGYQSPIKAMEIPGLRRASFRHGARQSRDIQQKTDASSSLLQMFHKSYLIYGADGFRYCRDGQIGELSVMQKVSTEFEMPRLPLIDPEGAALRGSEAIRVTEALARRVAEQPPR